MVLCIIALPIFAILGIFSVRYRKLAKESLECIFRTATFRKCKSGLDDRIKSEVTGKVMKFFPKIAGFIFRYHRILSWLVLALLLWSAYGTAVGVYNYYQYGNCNGPSDTGFCMLDPTGQNTKTSEIDIDLETQVIYPSVSSHDLIIGNPHAELTIIEFGCYSCPYTKKAEPIIKEVLDYYKGRVNLQFKTFYIPHHPMSYWAAIAAGCAEEQGKIEEYHTMLFEIQGNQSNSSLKEIASTIDLNKEKFSECLETQKYKSEVDSNTLEGVNAGVTGTPTFFINHQKIVGPKPFRTFKNIIDEELEK